MAALRDALRRNPTLTDPSDPSLRVSNSHFEAAFAKVAPSVSEEVRPIDIVLFSLSISLFYLFYLFIVVLTNWGYRRRRCTTATAFALRNSPVSRPGSATSSFRKTNKLQNKWVFVWQLFARNVVKIFWCSFPSLVCRSRHHSFFEMRSLR